MGLASLLDQITGGRLSDEDRQRFLAFPRTAQDILLNLLPKAKNPDGARQNIQQLVKRMDEMEYGKELRVDFDPALPAVCLYAPEDTKMTYVTLRTTLQSISTPPTLVDLCTGNSLVPSQLLIERRIKRFVATDIDIEAAIKFQSDIKEPMPESKIDHFDVLHDDPSTLSVESAHNILVSSNPPWVPTPPNLSREVKNRHAAAFPSIAGGSDGLLFYPKILDVAHSLHCEYVCVNLPSIVDLNAFETMLASKDFAIHHVHALETYSYGFDAEQEVQSHYKKITSAVFRNDDGYLRYLLLGLILKKSTLKNTSFQSLQGILKNYRSKGFVKMNQGKEDFCELYRLSKTDEMRIIGKI